MDCLTCLWLVMGCRGKKRLGLVSLLNVMADLPFKHASNGGLASVTLTVLHVACIQPHSSLPVNPTMTLAHSEDVRRAQEPAALGGFGREEGISWRCTESWLQQTAPLGYSGSLTSSSCSPVLHTGFRAGLELLTPELFLYMPTKGDFCLACK